MAIDRGGGADFIPIRYKDEGITVEDFSKPFPDFLGRLGERVSYPGDQSGIINALPNIINNSGVTTREGALIDGDDPMSRYGVQQNFPLSIAPPNPFTTQYFDDLIMNPEGVPNALQNIERFAPGGRFDAYFNALGNEEEIPGFNFKDAPIETPFLKRMFDDRFKEFRNNPAVENPLEKIGSGITSTIDKAKSGVRKGIDLGKAAISGILSLATGIPGIGALANLLPERDYRQSALEDFYGSVQDGTIQGGLMAGYNPVSGGLFGKPVQYGLSPAIDRRIARIQKTLQKKDSETLRQRVKALEELKKQEAAALEAARAKQAAELESQRRGRRPGSGGDDGPGVCRRAGV